MRGADDLPIERDPTTDEIKAVSARLMSAQDAREQAWEAFHPTRFTAAETNGVRAGFRAGWDAAKREDEQRIAALVAALLWKHTGRIGISWEDALKNRPFHALVVGVQRETAEFMRALAGSEGSVWVE